MANTNHCIILAAKRTPIGQFNGHFKQTKATQLGSAVIDACINVSQIKAEEVDQVIMGCVLPAGLGQAPARQAALGAKLSISTPCVTINKMCGSGMQSVIFASDAIAAGSSQMVVAGGFENMSQAPYLLTKARSGYRLGSDTLYDHMMLDGLEDAFQPGRPMGYFAEQCAEHFNFSREQQDAFALASLQRAQTAADKNLFSEELCSVSRQDRHQLTVITADEGPGRIEANKIPLLKPVFKKDGTVTAANASSISDGAAALILCDNAYAEQQQLCGIAKVVAHATYAAEPEWFTTAPIGAIRGVLSKAQWNQSDVDLFEINEAFAVVTLVTMQTLGIPHEIVNVHGGACALGHPVGASGARIIATLIHALRQRGLKKGIAALCIGGGEATAVAIELINP